MYLYQRRVFFLHGVTVNLARLLLYFLARITVNFKLDQNLNFNGSEVVGKLSAPNTDPAKVSEENY